MAKRQDREEAARHEGAAAARSGDPRKPPHKGDLAVCWLAGYDLALTGGAVGVQSQAPPVEAQTTGYVVRRAHVPCPCCGRKVLDSGYKACVVLATHAHVAYMQCRACRDTCQACEAGRFKVAIVD